MHHEQRRTPRTCGVQVEDLAVLIRQRHIREPFTDRGPEILGQRRQRWGLVHATSQ